MYSRHCLVLAVFFAGTNSAIAQIDIDTVDAVELIESFEENVAFVQYEMRVFETDATEVEQEWKVSKPAPKPPSFKTGEIGVYSSRYAVALAPSEQWFLVNSRVVGKSVFRASDGDSDIFTYNIHDSKYSSDGDTFKYQVIGERFKKPPLTFDDNGDASWGRLQGMRVESYGVLSTWESHPNHIGDGSATAFEKFGGAWGFNALGCMAWTDFESPVLLSQFLRRKIAAGEEIAVRETTNGILEIFCPIHNSHTHQYSVKFFYDAVRGRVIRVEWGGCVVCDALSPDDWEANRLGIFRYDDETVLPYELIQVELPFRKYKRGMRCEARYTRLTNRKVESAREDKAFFDFEFSPGIELSDYINERVYIVGAGLENDVASAEKFMQLNGLVHGETTKLRGYSWVLWTAVVLGLIIVCVFLRKRMIFALLVASLSFTQSAEISLAASPQLGTVDEKTAGGTSHARQCGQLVAAATCAYFRIKADARILKAVMQPKQTGTSLLQIKQALELHGLSVAPRRFESTRRLERLVAPDVVVIIPLVMPNGRGHFVMLLQNGLDNPPVLVDVLNAVSPVSETRLSDNSLQQVNGVVLMVQQEREPPRVNVRPGSSRVVLGDINIDDPESDILDFEIELTNKSNRAALVEFKTSCGCMRPRKPAILIDANSSCSAGFFLSRGGWGLGEIERQIECLPKNGSSFRVSICGRGVRHSMATGNDISLSSRHLMIRSLPYTSADSLRFAAGAVHVRGSKELLADVTVEAEYDWIKTAKGTIETEDVGGESGVTLAIEVSPHRELYERLNNSTRQFSSVLKLSTSGGKQLGEITLTLVRERAVKWRVGSIRSTAHGYLCEVELMGASQGLDFEVRDFYAVGQSLLPSVEATDRQHVFVVRWRKESENGSPGLIKFEVAGVWGEEVVVVPCGSPQTDSAGKE